MELLQTNILTDSQRKRIFMLTRQAGISNEELHNYLPQWCGGNSLSSQSGITTAQANKVIDALTKIIEKKNTQKDKPSYSQIKAIKTVQTLLRWDQLRLERFIYHTTKKFNIDSLTIREASAVILGLNKVRLTLTKAGNKK